MLVFPYEKILHKINNRYDKLPTQLNIKGWGRKSDKIPMIDNEKMKGTFDLARPMQHIYKIVKLESMYFIEFLRDFYYFCYGF